MKILLRACFCAVLLGLSAGCENLLGIAPPSPSAALPADAAVQLPALEVRLFAQIAEERQKAHPGTKALVLDAELTEIARARSGKMAHDNSFADGGGDPHVSASMLMAKNAAFQGMVGENVAAVHFSPSAGVDAADMAERFMAVWLASPQHKESLLFSDYNSGGIGAAVGGDMVYVTVLLAADFVPARGGSAPPSQGTPVANPPANKDDDATAPHEGAGEP